MEQLLAVAATLVSLVAALYWYLTKNYTYWKDVGIPYVPAIPIFGSLGKIFKNPMQYVEMQRYKKYGRLYGHYEGQRPVLNVADPELLRHIFVKDFHAFTSRRDMVVGDPIGDNMVNILQGEKWKRVRTIITPAFTTGKIKKMTSIILECAKTVADNFATAAKAGKPIDGKRLFGGYSMDVIASSAFAMKIDSHNDPNNEFVITARQAFSRDMPWRAALLFMAPSIMKFFGVSIFAPTSTSFFKNVTMQMIAERRRTGQRRNDFLQMMMDIQEESESKTNPEESVEENDDVANPVEAHYGHEENNKDVFKPIYRNKALSRDELVAQCVIFFLAGYDTTASTLSFAAYNLALNPHCQEELIAEVDETIQKEKGQLTYEGVQSMKYLDKVVSETLRAFPVAIRLERMADEDYKLGTTGFTIPKGMIVGIPIYAMHHDPEFYPEPEKFDPNRFDTEAKAQRHPYTYLPFGAGPRNCLGMRFALMEIKICLAYLLSRFRMKTCSETKVPLDYFVGQGILQPKQVMFSVEVREDKVCD